MINEFGVMVIPFISYLFTLKIRLHAESLFLRVGLFFEKNCPRPLLEPLHRLNTFRCIRISPEAA